MSFWFFIMIGLYLLMLATVGYRSWKRSKTAEDYIMAGSRIGVLVGMLTFAATLFSTFTLMGMPDFFRTHGVGAWIFLAISDAAMFFGVLYFGVDLRKAAKRYNYQGMAGMLSRCYGSSLAGVVYLIGVFCFLIPYVAIQIRGIAIFLTAVFPDLLPSWGWSVGIICVMLAYSEVGGLRAIIHCDCIQGTILLIVLWIIAYGCLHSLGGIRALFDQVQETNAALLSVPGPKGLFTVQFLLASFLAILFMPITQPQVVTRLVIVKSRKTLMHMAVGLGLFTALVLIPTIAIGLYGAVKHGSLSTSDFLAQVLLHEQPDVLAAIVVVGLLAAATSTADSQLFALGSELRSFLLLLRGESSLLVMRLTVLGFGVAALVFSIISSDQLVLMARVSFAGTSLMAPMVLAAVFSKKQLGVELVICTGLALILFLGSQFGWIPSQIGPLRLDLLLLLGLGVITLLSLYCFPRQHRIDV